MHSSPLRVYRSLRCAPLRVYITNFIVRAGCSGWLPREESPCGSSFASLRMRICLSAVCAIVCQRPSIHHLRPSATVAAWHPGLAAPVRGRASIPPGVVSTGSGAAVRRDLPGFVSACVHPCPEKGPLQTFLPHLSASTGPASFLADPDHAAAIRKSKQSAKRSSHRPKFLVAVAAEARSKRYFQLSGLWPGRLRRLSR